MKPRTVKMPAAKIAASGADSATDDKKVLRVGQAKRKRAMANQNAFERLRFEAISPVVSAASHDARVAARYLYEE